MDDKKHLIGQYSDLGIRSCELHFDNQCWKTYGLSFAHRRKRRYYLNKDNLWTFAETILACPYCHNKIEYDKELTNQVFRRLRKSE